MTEVQDTVRTPPRGAPNLKEASPLDPGQAVLEAQRCLYCYDAPCIAACPTAIDIPTFIRKIASGNVRGAARTILNANLLGASCARVCPVQVLCEGACVFLGADQPAIEIGRLQRHAMDLGAAPDLLRRAPPLGTSVACIGAGPASLSCAGTLALLGHEVVVYEQRSLAGGLNTTGIAPYKIAAATALEEVRFIEALGVEIRKGVRIGSELKPEELLARHDALFLAPGLGRDRKLCVPGEDSDGVVGATAWIERLKTDPDFTVAGIERALVVGGGNTAVDVARELVKLGVLSVRLVYRGALGAMRAYRHELAAANQEGVVLVPGSVVREIVREDGRVTGVLLASNTPDSRSGAEPTLEPADLVVIAVGQAPADLAQLLPDVTIDERGLIVTDAETLQTGNPRIFAGGDARNGGREVVHAVDEGQRAARAIDAMLRRERLARDDS